MTSNSNLKKAIRAAQEVSGLSYTEQRRGTILAQSEYEFTNCTRPTTLSELLIEVIEYTMNGYPSATEFDEAVRGMGIEGTFHSANGIQKMFVTWNSFLVKHGENSFDGYSVSSNDYIHSDKPVNYMYGDSDFGANKELSDEKSQRLLKALYSAGEYVLKDKFRDTHDFINEDLGYSLHGTPVSTSKYVTIKDYLYRNAEARIVLGEELAQHWAYNTGVSIDELKLGGHELYQLLIDHQLFQRKAA